jgi:RNA polymerase sigma-70 factor, ECF subfamily
LALHLRLFFEVQQAPLPMRLKKLVSRLQRALGEYDHPAEPWFEHELLAALPSLRSFALSLAGDVDRANDLVQETVLRALDRRATFQPGTNLMAWLFTILRNAFYTDHRKRSREVEDVDGIFAERLRTCPDQLEKLHFQDLQAALARLSPEQRQVLLLIGADGMRYDEAAVVCNVAIGTIKSRANRARARLAELLGYDPNELTSDKLTQAALTGPDRASADVHDA